MTLEEAIKELAKDNVDKTNDWYRWRTINESKLPNGIKLPEGNQYTKNLSLKTQLNNKLKSVTTHNEKKQLFKYYIRAVRHTQRRADTHLTQSHLSILINSKSPQLADCARSMFERQKT